MSEKAINQRAEGNAEQLVGGNSVSIGGNTSGCHIAGGDIHYHIHAERVVHRHKVVIHPGPEHIGDEQRARLKSLVDEVVQLESAIKRYPKTYASVWKALNAKVKASSYHLILAEHYPAAEKFLRAWIGRLSSAKSAPTKAPDWRKRKYAFIHTNTKQLGADGRLETLLSEKYGAASLKELSDADLAAVYQAVAWWKRK